MEERDFLIKILDESDPEGGVYSPDDLEDFWGTQADAVLRYFSLKSGLAL